MATLPVLDDAISAKPVSTRAVGRLPRYSLRVSVLEQCPFHCPYCAPGSVTPPTDKARWLDAAAYARLGRLFRARGVTKVRITGGEPLARPDVVAIVAAWKEAMPDADLALTTNGQRLAQHVDALANAGLRRVTVHIDSLRDDRYRALMGDSSPSTILEAAHHARAKLAEVKLNVVIQRGKNDDEIADFLALSARTGFEVRFIELMSTGSADEYARHVFVSGAEIVERAEGSALARRHASDPAALYRSNSGVVFGVIASDTEPFCSACDRLRLTADGRLRGCLYQSGGVPVGAALKSGASDETLGALLDAGLDDKRSWHPLVAPHRVPFSMADVGG
jgi:cyclic pyranopterin phosphate synthase